MKVVPNIGTPMRIFYVVAGAAIAAYPFVASSEGWERVVLPLLGAMAIIGGAAGW